MKVAVFGAKKYDVEVFTAAIPGSNLTFTFLEPLLGPTTAILAVDHEAACIFVNDTCDKEVLQLLHGHGVKYIALRCAGYNNVNLQAAGQLGLKVCHVPAYSPEAVAEFTVGMLLTVIRKYHKAYNRVREGNFLLDGLVGFNLSGKTVGIVGTGKIGLLTGRILARGFGCIVVAYDPYPCSQADEHEITYVPTLDGLWARSDVVSLHCPLTDGTRYIINEDSLSKMKKGVVLINTSRGGLIHTHALIQALKTGHVAAVGLDVFERESGYFFTDSSAKVIHDDTFARLLTFYNVFMSGHQAYLTEEALSNIAQTTICNLQNLEKTGSCSNVIQEHH